MYVPAIWSRYVPTAAGVMCHHINVVVYDTRTGKGKRGRSSSEL
jgi:hypothetical protein